MADILRTDEATPGRTPRRPAGTTVRGAAWTVVIAALLAWSWSAPAHAQRFARRSRQAPPAPRAPARTAPPAAAPGRSPTPAPGARGGSSSAAEKPQTTAAPPRTPSPAGPPAPEAPTSIAAADVAWDGVTPFGAEWRRRHPGAWSAAAGSGEILLTAAAEPSTDGERSPPPSGMPRSVLEPTAGEAELLVFPSDPSVDAPAAEEPASDGTVSVLARDGADARRSDRTPGPIAAPEQGKGGARAGGTLAAGSDDARGSPWLELGAFAAVPDGQASGVTPHVFLELSLHRDGTVRGNYYDALTDAVLPVSGKVDRDAGTLAWRVGNGPEFLADAEGLATGRAPVTVRRGATERAWTLIALE